jgi:benzoate/toluate 1,2-dioxygenase alpha subunit
MATPDDLAEFQGVQEGHRATPAAWNDLSRGASHWVQGPDELAKKSGFYAMMSGAKIEDEGLFIVQHQAWQQRMATAIKANSVNEINPNPSIHL